MYGNNFPAMDQNDLLQVVPRPVFTHCFWPIDFICVGYSRSIWLSLDSTSHLLMVYTNITKIGQSLSQPPIFRSLLRIPHYLLQLIVK